jgi:hypothetical protein
MIILLLIGLTIWCNFPAAAQNTDTTETNKLKQATASMKEKSGGSRDRIVVEYTFDQWIHNETSLKVKWYSRGFNAYFMYDIQIGKRKFFSVAPGAGVGTSSMFTNAQLIKDSAGTNLVARTDNYKKNKLGLTYIDVPLELRFRTKPSPKNNSFKIALGFKAGILADGKTKVKQKDPQGDLKVYKEKRFEDLNRFRYGVTLRIGYGPINVVGYYALSKIFDNGRGPSITPYSIGLSLSGL